MTTLATPSTLEHAKLDRRTALRTLRAHEKDLRERFAVRKLAVFGSVVRDEADRRSDLDLLVEFDKPVGFFHLSDTSDYISGLFDGIEVDLVLRRAVIPEFRDRIYGEAVDVLA